jgi:hypothetical protein
MSTRQNKLLKLLRSGVDEIGKATLLDQTERSSKRDHSPKVKNDIALSVLTNESGHSTSNWVATVMTTVKNETCGGWVPSRESDSSKSEQVKQCMDLEHFIH